MSDSTGTLDGLVDRFTLAKLFRVDARTVLRYAAEGMPRTGSKFDPFACVPWYVERERERAKASKGLNDLDLARQRKTLADAQKAEAELALIERSMIPLTVHEERFGKACDQLAGVLKGVPSKFAGRIQVARTDAEAIAVGNAIRDETLRALQSVDDDDDGAGDAEA